MFLSCVLSYLFSSFYTLQILLHSGPYMYHFLLFHRIINLHINPIAFIHFFVPRTRIGLSAVNLLSIPFRHFLQDLLHPKYHIVCLIYQVDAPIILLYCVLFLHPLLHSIVHQIRHSIFVFYFLATIFLLHAIIILFLCFFFIAPPVSLHPSPCCILLCIISVSLFFYSVFYLHFHQFSCFLPFVAKVIAS